LQIKVKEREMDDKIRQSMLLWYGTTHDFRDDTFTWINESEGSFFVKLLDNTILLVIKGYNSSKLSPSDWDTMMREGGKLIYG
jgi:hypothetical protein